MSKVSLGWGGLLLSPSLLVAELNNIESLFESRQKAKSVSVRREKETLKEHGKSLRFGNKKVSPRKTFLSKLPL